MSPLPDRSSYKRILQVDYNAKNKIAFTSNRGDMLHPGTQVKFLGPSEVNLSYL